MGFTTAQKRNGLNSMNVYAQRSRLGDLVYGASATGYPLDYPGVAYYVNNITGAAANDGLSWQTAVAQPSTAVTKVLAFQAAQSTASLDPNVRCTIFIAGTLTAYDGLTALAGMTDYVGIGASPLGNGYGIPRIGSDTAAEDGVKLSATLRGANFYNLQFQAGSAKSCFTATALYRSGFYNCAFMVNGVATSATTGFTAANLSGVEFIDCHWGTASNVEPTVGFDVTGTYFHHCRVENCEITGLTAGFRLASTATINYGSVVKTNGLARH